MAKPKSAVDLQALSIEELEAELRKRRAQPRKPTKPKAPRKPTRPNEAISEDLFLVRDLVDHIEQYNVVKRAFTLYDIFQLMVATGFGATKKGEFTKFVFKLEERHHCYECGGAPRINLVTTVSRPNENYEKELKAYEDELKLHKKLKEDYKRDLAEWTVYRAEQKKQKRERDAVRRRGY